jgi:hypothetical protein
MEVDYGNLMTYIKYSFTRLCGGTEYVEVSAVGGDEVGLEQGNGVKVEMGSKHVNNN